MILSGDYTPAAALAGISIAPTTLDPAAKSPLLVLSNGNLTASGGPPTGTTHLVALSTRHKTTGKYHIEAPVGGINNNGIGFALGSFNLGIGNYLGQNADSIGWFNDGFVGNGGTNIFGLTGFGVGAVITADINAGSKRCWFGANGTQISGDPVAGTGGFDLSAWGADFYFAVDVKSSADVLTVNFGATPYSFPTSGFGVW